MDGTWCAPRTGAGQPPVTIWAGATRTSLTYGPASHADAHYHSGVRGDAHSYVHAWALRVASAAYPEGLAWLGPPEQQGLILGPVRIFVDLQLVDEFPEGGTGPLKVRPR